MIESLRVSKYIDNLLTYDTTLQTLTATPIKVYNEGAPHGAGSGPYIVFNVPGGPDSNTLDGNRILVPGDVNIITCIQDRGYGPIRAIAERIDDLMVGTEQMTIDGVFITKFVRRSIVMMSDAKEDIYWYYLGGVYSADTFAYG